MEERYYISCIIPALDEEGNLENTIIDIEKNLAPFIKKTEIIVVNDGSIDKTSEIAERLLNNKRINHIIHHVRPYGMGFSFRDGVFRANGDYVVMIPGDNEMDISELRKTLPFLEDNDFVLPYTVNKRIRSGFRRILSLTYIFLINTLFRVRLEYSNGCVIYKREIFNHLNIVTDGFTFQAEIVLKAIRIGYKYKEVGVNIRPRAFGKSKATKLKNFYDVFWSLFIIFLEIYILRKYNYKAKEIKYESIA